MHRAARWWWWKPAGELLRRVWCLYELWQTILLRGANKLQLLTGDVDTTRLAQVHLIDCFSVGPGAVLCCAVLCCAVLCCAVLCCAVLG